MDTREFEIVGEWGLGDMIGGIGSRIGQVAGQIVGTLAGAAGAASAAGAGIIDLTDKADKSNRHGMRPAAQVKALVLHQMACCRNRKNALTDYLKIGSHFAIMADGRILQLHPELAMVWASNGFNHGSVAVEFAGNFPNTKGKWWQGDKYGRDQVTPAQLEAGRRLVRYLVAKIGLKTILAHRQSSASRENDPGPDIWYHVGQWAVDTLKLSDGGSGFKVGDGNAIPDLWRTWGRSAPVKEAEFGGVGAGEFGAGEFGEGEGEQEGEQQAEQESAFGPLNARLSWLPKSYSRAQIVRAGSSFAGFGGVYIAFEPAAAGVTDAKPKILKVGMSDTFARRMGDPAHIALNRAHPKLQYYLAKVHGHRGAHGVAGVVRMVELALARLLRRSDDLTDAQLPFKPSMTRGPVKIVNVLPPQLQTAMTRALRKTPIDPKPFDPMPPGQLVLPRGVRWEFEQIGPA
ncbi:N-acetylmuramoyl-L-alanine amidase [Roseateles sp. UC29_93]|uniref:peptidoglycan recognition protein family protein n=1 Tax=Roseateles sp. UC29_93 TaxID=3350177 RepID=UPI0036724E56